MKIINTFWLLKNYLIMYALCTAKKVNIHCTITNHYYYKRRVYLSRLILLWNMVNFLTLFFEIVFCSSWFLNKNGCEFSNLLNLLDVIQKQFVINNHEHIQNTFVPLIQLYKIKKFSHKSYFNNNNNTVVVPQELKSILFFTLGIVL